MLQYEHSDDARRLESLSIRRPAPAPVFLMRDDERQQAVAEWLRQPTLLRQLAVTLPAILYVRAALPRRLLHVEGPLWDLWGYDPDQWLAWGDYQRFVHLEEWESFRQWSLKVARLPDGAVASLRVRLKDSQETWRWCSVRETVIARLADGRAGLVFGVLTDSSETHRVEAEWRASEARYSRLFEAATDVVYTTDLAGRFTSVNAAGPRLTGYTRQQLLRMSATDLVVPEDHPALERLRTLRQKAGQAIQELRIRHRAGNIVCLEVSSSLLFQDGEPATVLGIARDVSVRKLADRFDQGRQDVLEMVAQDRPLPAILRRVIELARQHGDDVACAVFVRHDRRLSLEAGENLPEEYCAAAAEGIAVSVAAGPCSAAAWWGQPVLVADLSRELRDPHAPVLLRHALRACWAMPLLSGAGEVLGVLALLHHRAHLPDAEQTSLLERVAQLAAVTVEHRRFTDQLAHQACHDPLTGLPNRLLLQDRLERAIQESRHRHAGVAVLLLDVDNFKMVNDTLGHAAGDQFLGEVSRRLRAVVRDTDTVARTGSDEFLLVVGGVKDPEAVKLVIQTLLDSFRVPFLVDNQEIYLTASLGIALCPQDSDVAATLQRHAEAALVAAKRGNRHSFAFYSAHGASLSRERFALLNDLHRALKQDEFVLLYQPIVSADSRPTGFEALLRWEHPRLGRLQPGQFVPLAEESGLIVEIGAWVLREACRQVRDWERRNLPPVKCAVNVSPLQFAHHQWVDTVAAVLRDTGLTPCRLDLELTESVVMHDVAESARRMATLRELGVSLSIDDFGTGYSSLVYLQQLPLSRLKVDASFVRQIQPGTGVPPLVKAIIAMAHGLGIRVTAEGIEEPHQLEALRALGCDEFQGFLIGRPLTAEAAETFLGV